MTSIRSVSKLCIANYKFSFNVLPPRTHISSSRCISLTPLLFPSSAKLCVWFPLSLRSAGPIGCPGFPWLQADVGSGSDAPWDPLWIIAHLCFYRRHKSTVSVIKMCRPTHLILSQFIVVTGGRNVQRVQSFWIHVSHIHILIYISKMLTL